MRLGRYLVFFLIILSSFFVSSCRNEQKQQEAWNRYKELSLKLRKLEVKNESVKSDLKNNEAEAEAVRNGLNGLAADCDVIIRDVYDPEKKALILSLKGEALGLANKVIPAEEVFDQAIKLAPDNYEIYFRYGKIYYNSRDYKKALSKFGKALIYVPKYKLAERIQILFYQGDIMEKYKQFPYAEKSYKDAVEIAENYKIDSVYYQEARRRLKMLEGE